MISVDNIEFERVKYVEEMKEYLENLKKQSKSNINQARKKVLDNLIKSNIIYKSENDIGFHRRPKNSRSK